MIATGVKARYFDISYIFRLYLDDAGCEAVRGLAAESDIVSAWHAQAEILCAFHRSRREGRLNEEQFRAQLQQFRTDCAGEAFQWLPLGGGVLTQIDEVLEAAPASTFLRAADALHLACAAENGFTEVYSNDRHFLAAASLFGLRGVNVIPAGASASALSVLR